MKMTRILGLAAMVAVSATLAWSAPLRLTPANPQPKGLKSGLTVRYAYPDDVKTLRGAAKALKAGAETGQPLKGLDYRDTSIGQNALTSKRSENVVADIRGYVRFDAPGIYTIDFLTNDGMRAVIGGKVVGKFDGRQTCQETFAQKVEVPKAGWYPLQVLYFQRLNTSCLHMRMGPKGSRVTWMPNKAFGR
ncbi:PA14 domain-containing protein [Phaeobacter sp. C3_T13_0]|uniref:PA14 domain-containing protein n=1 Tax=Phaeobacter cretensis TaxID=3342641 RepID=UPI0039BCF47D